MSDDDKNLTRFSVPLHPRPLIPDDLITQALATAGPARRDRVFAVAELWHRHHGVLPSIQETRTLVGRGSYGDISRDLKDFATIIAAKTAHTATIPGLPRDLELKVAEVIAGLWQTIYEQAQGEFVADRAVLEDRLTTVTRAREAADAERGQALEDRSTALARLAEVERQLSAAQVSVTNEMRTVSERNITITQLQTRIGEMETERVRLQAEHVTELRALQAQLKERENRILDLQGAAGTLKAGYEARLSAAHQLETEHRMRADRAETARAALQEAVPAAAGEGAHLRGQLDALQPRLVALEELRTASLTAMVRLEHEVTEHSRRAEAAIGDNARLSNELKDVMTVLADREARLKAFEPTPPET